ncbi:hypothetical protein V2G26_013327 [Clonostachys chloroleuca]
MEGMLTTRLRHHMQWWPDYSRHSGVKRGTASALRSAWWPVTPPDLDATPKLNAIHSSQQAVRNLHLLLDQTWILFLFRRSRVA